MCNSVWYWRTTFQCRIIDAVVSFYESSAPNLVITVLSGTLYYENTGTWHQATAGEVIKMSDSTLHEITLNCQGLGTCDLSLQF